MCEKNLSAVQLGKGFVLTLLMLFLHCVHLCCVSLLFMMFDILYLSFGLPTGTLFCSILLKHTTKSAQTVSKKCFL